MVTRAVTRRVVPIDLADTSRRHLEGAVRWLLVAQQSSSDRGIPAFFDLLRGRWAPSYPETTGYTIPTFLACAAAGVDAGFAGDHKRRPHGRFDDGQPRGASPAALRRVALEMANYLLWAQTPEGGVAHWGPAPQAKGVPIVFDTGQVVFGWLAAWRETGDGVYLDAAARAGDWLVSMQSASGSWLAHQHLGVPKVIDTRVAWALLDLAAETSRERYVTAARGNLEWALQQQDAQGWFRHAAFRFGEDPSTHTLAYTAEGLLESSILLGVPRFAEAARRVADAVLAQQRENGWLAGRYGPAWRPRARWSCLTGNCQFALLWLRLHGIGGEARYLEGARRALGFVAGTQDLGSADRRVRGAISGSHPVWGAYERLIYPNWAAKFFVDGLLGLEGLNGS